MIPWIELIDHSEAILFLRSEEARHIAGLEPPVNAGCLAEPAPPEQIREVGASFDRPLPERRDLSVFDGPSR